MIKSKAALQGPSALLLLSPAPIIILPPTPYTCTIAAYPMSERLCHCMHDPPSLAHLRPSHTCTIPLAPHLLQPPTPAPYGTTMASQWRPIAAHAHAHSARCTRRCQSESCAPLVRCARSRRARGGACRVVAVIVRGRQPSAGRRAGRLSPAARAPRRGCSAPCAS